MEGWLTYDVEEIIPNLFRNPPVIKKKILKQVQDDLIN